MCDYAVMVKERAKVFLGGPPWSRWPPERSRPTRSWEGEMHSRTSGLSDYFALDEHDAIRIGREIIVHLNWRKLGPGPSMPSDDPVHDPEDLLGIIPRDLRIPFDMREVLARVLDGLFSTSTSRCTARQWSPVGGRSTDSR